LIKKVTLTGFCPLCNENISINIGILSSLLFDREHSRKIRVGLDRARSKGKKLGRKPKNIFKEEIIELFKLGNSYRKIATMKKCSSSYVCNIINNESKHDKSIMEYLHKNKLSNRMISIYNRNIQTNGSKIGGNP